LLTNVELELTPEPDKNAVYCKAAVRCAGQTGVEMEAITAVQVALLVIYDMCKAVDRGMTMEGIGLLEKSGGKSGHWRRSA
jgi:cyclic pyranopterin phosphate synthase